jgi:hypothetical protein
VIFQKHFEFSNSTFNFRNVLASLRCNPLARSPGQVVRPLDKRNFIGTSPNGQLTFLLLDLYLHDHQNVFSKEFNLIMTIFHVRGLFLQEAIVSKFGKWEKNVIIQIYTKCSCFFKTPEIQSFQNRIKQFSYRIYE